MPVELVTIDLAMRVGLDDLDAAIDVTPHLQPDDLLREVTWTLEVGRVVGDVKLRAVSAAVSAWSECSLLLDRVVNTDGLDAITTALDHVVLADTFYTLRASPGAAFRSVSVVIACAKISPRRQRA